MIYTILDCAILIVIAHFALFQANLESIKAKTFFGEVGAWTLAFLMTVVVAFKLFDRFNTDPASVLDVLKHVAFLGLCVKYYCLTKKSLTKTGMGV